MAHQSWAETLRIFLALLQSVIRCGLPKDGRDLVRDDSLQLRQPLNELAAKVCVLTKLPETGAAKVLS